MTFHALLKLLGRWRGEAEKKGHRISRIAVAFEAGHDGFWLARWLAAQGIEAHVIHASSVAVTREHRRAKTDRLDTGLLKRGFLGWLRGERGHCKMVAVPTLAEEEIEPCPMWPTHNRWGCSFVAPWSNAAA
jgi:transposase